MNQIAKMIQHKMNKNGAKHIRLEDSIVEPEPQMLAIEDDYSKENRIVKRTLQQKNKSDMRLSSVTAEFREENN